jgi:hypothetical protein
MEHPQRRLGGAEIGGIAVGLGDVQRHAVDPAAHQHAAAGEEQRRRDPEPPGDRERAAFAPEQQMRQTPAPPRHAVEAAQHRFDLAGLGAETAAFDGGEHIALEHDAFAIAPASSFGSSPSTILMYLAQKLDHSAA